MAINTTYGHLPRSRKCHGCGGWDGEYGNPLKGPMFVRDDGSYWHRVCWFESEAGKQMIALARASGEDVDDEGRVRIRVRW